MINIENNKKSDMVVIISCWTFYTIETYYRNTTFEYKKMKGDGNVANCESVQNIFNVIQQYL